MISVNARNKKLAGDFKNRGARVAQQTRTGTPEGSRFGIREPDKGEVAPCEVYDLGCNVELVSVGVDRGTVPSRSEFAGYVKEIDRCLTS